MFLPSLPERSSLLEVFKAYPETSRPLIHFHEVLVEGLGVEFDAAYVPMAAERLAKRGYMPLIAMLPR